jgi:hypothetical protein
VPTTQLEATTHRIETRYALPGPLIQEEALGTNYTYSKGDATVTLTFPRDPRDFYESRESETPYVPALSPEQPRLEGTPRIWALNIMQLAVDIPGFGSMHDKETLPFEDIRDEVEKSWYRGAEISNREITRFMSWLRVETAQSWLGTGDEPSMQYGRSYLRDLEHGGLLIAFGEEQSITMRHGEIGASVESLERIRSKMDADEDVPPELELFADARFLPASRTLWTVSVRCCPQPWPPRSQRRRRYSDEPRPRSALSLSCYLRRSQMFRISSLISPRHPLNDL